MLQQTQAVTVLPYYLRWMETFPDFLTLSKASDLEVIKCWEGLGYYSRARNLKGIALRVVEEFNGTFPSDYEDILSFKGIGPYTAAAISHFAFQKRAIGADGNINRVIARYYGHKKRVDIEGGILHFLDQFLPFQKSELTFEALIELGATYCTKKPKCHFCPIKEKCVAFNEELTAVLPIVKQRQKVEKLYRRVFIIEMDGKIVVKRGQKGLMEGLVEFPYLEMDPSLDPLKGIQTLFSCTLHLISEGKMIVQSFTKYKAYLFPFFCSLSGTIRCPEGYTLISIEELFLYPFSSGHKKILENYLIAR
jgi:A/G-specific adenine glycosylase